MQAVESHGAQGWASWLRHPLHHGSSVADAAAPAAPPPPHPSAHELCARVRAAIDAGAGGDAVDAWLRTGGEEGLTDAQIRRCVRCL